MDAARFVARVACARRLGMLARALGTLYMLVLFSAMLAPHSAAAKPSRERTFAPIMGVVRAPDVPGIPLHHRKPESQAKAGGKAKASNVATIDFTDSRLALRRSVSYRTRSGESIVVSVSARYRADSGADRLLVNYLSSLLHGDEISGLRLMVLRGDEIGRKCGVGTAACYLPGSDTIVVVGEDRFGGLPTDYVLAHEYGHRVAHYSFNPPFRGGAFWHGPKNWASYEKVCSKIKRGKLSLARGAYWNFPGENFAEAYARYHIRGQVRWQYSLSLKPDSGAFAAIRRDVRNPWMGPRVMDVKRWLGPGESRTYTFRTPRDGRFIADLYSQGDGRFYLELSRHGRTLARSSRPTRDFRISRLICGSRQFELTVRAAGVGGSYRLVVERP